jgi:hypothetical protein
MKTLNKSQQDALHALEKAMEELEALEFEPIGFSPLPEGAGSKERERVWNAAVRVVAEGVFSALTKYEFEVIKQCCPARERFIREVIHKKLGLL